MTELNELEELRALGDETKAAEAAQYHRATRVYLGVSVPVIDTLARRWREGLDVPGRVALASALWDSDVHEARVAAAKLLTQARIRPDDGAWALIASWVPQFDSWAIADQAMKAGERRLIADPSRLDEVEQWIEAPSFWARRAALVGTLPWTRMNNPRADDLAQRERILGWLVTLADDRQGFVQKAIAWWLRDLSKHDPERVQSWLAEHGDRLKPYARAEAARRLPTGGPEPI